MYDFSLYVFQLAVASVLIALALSVYVDGIGYVVFHILGLTGLGGYSYAILTTQYGWSPFLALVISSVVGIIGGLICAEVIRPLRGDGLTLATFGVGIGAFELFRYLKITGGVYGMSRLPVLVSPNGFLSSVGFPSILLLTACLGVAMWRRSLGGAIVSSIRLNEWAAVSLGARLTAHQRITGGLSGCLAGAAGAYFASTTGFIEPRDFRPTSLLFPLAATIIAAGRTPSVVVLTAMAVVTLSQTVRFLGAGPAVAGPIAEIMIAVILGAAFVLIRILKIEEDGIDLKHATHSKV